MFLSLLIEEFLQMKPCDSQCCVRTGKKEMQNYPYPDLLVEFSLALQNLYFPIPGFPISCSANTPHSLII